MREDLKVVVESLAAILAILEHVADLSWVVVVHRLKMWTRIIYNSKTVLRIPTCLDTWKCLPDPWASWKLSSWVGLQWKPRWRCTRRCKPRSHCPAPPLLRTAGDRFMLISYQGRCLQYRSYNTLALAWAMPCVPSNAICRILSSLPDFGLSVVWSEFWSW